MRHVLLILLFTTANTLFADSTLNSSVKYISVLPGGYRYFTQELNNYASSVPFVGAGIMFGIQKNKWIWNVRFNYASMTRYVGNTGGNICFDCYTGKVNYEFGEIAAGFIREIGTRRFRFFYSSDLYYHKMRYVSHLDGGIIGSGYAEDSKGYNLGISGGVGVKYNINKRLFIGLESNLFLQHSYAFNRKTYYAWQNKVSQDNYFWFNPVRNIFLGIRL